MCHKLKHTGINISYAITFTLCSMLFYEKSRNANIKSESVNVLSFKVIIHADFNGSDALRDEGKMAA